MLIDSHSMATATIAADTAIEDQNALEDDVTISQEA
jgi:hypothetical protein